MFKKYMNFRTFEERLGRFTLFSLRDIRKTDPRFDRRRLTEWQQRGLILKISRGYYVFQKKPLNETALFSIAHALYRPSYVSLAMAFSYYGFIPEGTFMVTSVTTRKTALFRTPVGDFSYRSLRPDLFFGYTLLPKAEQSCTIAEPEKAILDMLYLSPTLRTDEDLEALRLHCERIRKRLNMATFHRYRKAFHSKALDARVSLFLSHLRHAVT